MLRSNIEIRGKCYEIESPTKKILTEAAVVKWSEMNSLSCICLSSFKWKNFGAGQVRVQVPPQVSVSVITNTRWDRDGHGPDLK